VAAAPARAGDELAPSGTVKWYDPKKGYGFIERPGEADLFVHHTNLDDTVGRLEEGEHVEFEIGPGRRGEEARRVRRARRAA
jgi:CspA family cold shock protein